MGKRKRTQDEIKVGRCLTDKYAERFIATTISRTMVEYRSRVVYLAVLALLSLGVQAQTRPSIADLQTEIATLQTEVAGLQSNTVLQLDGYLSLDDTDLAKPIAAFDGVNVQIVNGTGTTNGPTNGVGNLIVGYNEPRSINGECSNPFYYDQLSCISLGFFWALEFREGSHNLVVGKEHNFSSYGGLVAGFRNSIRQWSASVSGGADNRANSGAASVSGGQFNNALSDYSSIGGGGFNQARGQVSSVSGGRSNITYGDFSSVSGGQGNDAWGEYSTVGGGYLREVLGEWDWSAGALFQDQ